MKKTFMTKIKEQIERIDNYCYDERFYRKQSLDGKDLYVPSVTYVLGCAYPYDFGLIQWRGDVGNKRAEEILEETSADGIFIHAGIEAILKDKEIIRKNIETTFSPRRSLKIMRCLKAFLDWYKEYQPIVLSTEYIIWNDQHKYAGTVDLKCQIGAEIYLIDFKSSKSIHNSHKVQVCAYNLASPCDKIAILHLGNTTKQKYSFLVLKDKEKKLYTEEWLQTNKLFQTLYPDAKPTNETFPDIFKI